MIKLGSSSALLAFPSPVPIEGYDYTWMTMERDGTSATPIKPTARWLSVPHEEASGSSWVVTVGANTPSGIEKVEFYRFSGDVANLVNDDPNDWTLIHTATSETTQTKYGTNLLAYHCLVDTTALPDGIQYFRAAVYARWNDGTNGIRHLWKDAYAEAIDPLTYGGTLYPTHFTRDASLSTVNQRESSQWRRKFGFSSIWSGEYTHTIVVKNGAAESDIFVDFQTGSDSTGDGSTGSPYKSVTKGIYEAATNGGRVVLKSGDHYFETDTADWGYNLGTKWVEVTSENTTSQASYSRIVGWTQGGLEGNFDPLQGGTSLPRRGNNSQICFRNVSFKINASDAQFKTVCHNVRAGTFRHMFNGVKGNALWFDQCLVEEEWRPDLVSSLRGDASWTLNEDTDFAGRGLGTEWGTFYLLSNPSVEQGFFVTDCDVKYQESRWASSFEINVRRSYVMFDVFTGGAVVNCTGGRCDQSLVPGYSCDGNTTFTWTIDSVDGTEIIGTLSGGSGDLVSLTVRADGTAELQLDQTPGATDPLGNALTANFYHTFFPCLNVTSALGGSYGDYKLFFNLAKSDETNMKIIWDPGNTTPDTPVPLFAYNAYIAAGAIPGSSYSIQLPGINHSDIMQVGTDYNAAGRLPLVNIYMDDVQCMNDVWSRSQGLTPGDNGGLISCSIRNVNLNINYDGKYATGEVTGMTTGYEIIGLRSLMLSTSSDGLLIEDCSFQYGDYVGAPYISGSTAYSNVTPFHTGAQRTLLRDCYIVQNTDGQRHYVGGTSANWQSAVGYKFLPSPDGPSGGFAAHYETDGFPGFPWTSEVTRKDENIGWDVPTNLEGGTGIRYEYT